MGVLRFGPCNGAMTLPSGPIAPVSEPAKMPANCGLFLRDRETVFRIGLRGGLERTRTACQARSPFEPVSV
jgi:hypothetical protein